jgi:hypothetical protein
VRPDKAKPGAETPYAGDPAKIWQINGASRDLHGVEPVGLPAVIELVQQAEDVAVQV